MTTCTHTTAEKQRCRVSVDTGVEIELEGRLVPNGTVPQQPATNSTSTRHDSTMADVIPPVSDAADSPVASSARVELPDATTQSKDW